MGEIKETMSNLKILANNLLMELTSEKFEAIDSLYNLCEQLENKSEPDTSELYLISVLNQTIEKIKLLESFLLEYTKSQPTLSSNKLSELYEKSEGYGASSIFD